MFYLEAVGVGVVGVRGERGIVEGEDCVDCADVADFMATIKGEDGCDCFIG